MKSLALFVILVPVAAALAVVACGDDDGDANGTPVPTSPPASISGPEPQPSPAQPLDETVLEPEDGVVEITVQNTAFVGNNIRVTVGEPVILRVTNEDPTTHSLRLAGIDGVFLTEDDAITEPDSIGEQGVGELTFAPSLPGAYTFRCDFHGTMGGQVTAE
jgi:plastocyanin